MTELQKHVAFFDKNHDGIITVDETYQGEPSARPAIPRDGDPATFRSFVVCGTPFAAIENLPISSLKKKKNC